MRYEMSSRQGLHKLPPTTAYQLLDDQLIVFLRAWGSQEYNQKMIAEITHFLSTAQADVEITSPFDRIENNTTLANKVRISLLLAHDYFYKVENKSTLSVGFEAAVVMRSHQEIAWAAVGRFDIHKLSTQQQLMISSEGSDQDESILLPVELLGVEKNFNLRCGSLSIKNEEIVVASVYQGLLTAFKDSSASEWHVDVDNQDATYWFSKLKSE